MLPFTRQIQITTDGVKGCMARLAGWRCPSGTTTKPRWTNCGRASARPSTTCRRSGGADRRQRRQGNRAAHAPGDPLRFTGEAYLKHYVLPNLYFHATTTYALLRHAGVDWASATFWRAERATRPAGRAGQCCATRSWAPCVRPGSRCGCALGDRFGGCAVGICLGAGLGGCSPRLAAVAQARHHHCHGLARLEALPAR
jgi:hypothetical protein